MTDLFDVGRQTLENGVENTARLAGSDHVDVEIVERLRVLAHRLGERRPALDVLPNLEDDLLEGLVLLLLTQDVQALHEGQTGIDHHRELPGEDRDVLGFHTAAEFGQGDLLALFLDRGDDDLLTAKSRNDGVFAVADQDTRLGGAVSVTTLPFVAGHLSSFLLGVPQGWCWLPRPD